MTNDQREISVRATAATIPALGRRRLGATWQSSLETERAMRCATLLAGSSQRVLPGVSGGATAPRIRPSAGRESRRP